MKKYFGIMFIIAMMLAAACSSSTGDDGATDPDTTTDSSTDQADAGTSDAGTAADAVAPAASYTWVVIFDDTTVCTGTGPGADIDTVAVYRDKKLIGVGKPKTADYAAGSGTDCDKNTHAKPVDVEACTGPLGDIDPEGVTTGYLSLGGGSVEFQIGGCANGEATIDKCDGKGDVVALQDGDEFEVYEVDKWYQDDKHKNPATTKNYITGQCKCDSEPYTVYIRMTKGVDATGVKVGSFTGTAVEKAELTVKLTK